MTSLIKSIFAAGTRRFFFVVPFVGLALFGCAKEEDKEQRLSRADNYSPRASISRLKSNIGMYSARSERSYRHTPTSHDLL